MCVLGLNEAWNSTTTNTSTKIEASSLNKTSKGTTVVSDDNLLSTTSNAILLNTTKMNDQMRKTLTFLNSTIGTGVSHMNFTWMTGNMTSTLDNMTSTLNNTTFTTPPIDTLVYQVCTYRHLEYCHPYIRNVFALYTRSGG